MTKVRLKSLRIEFTTTGITKEELCLKHKVKLEELKGHESWSKEDGSYRDDDVSIQNNYPKVEEDEAEINTIEHNPVRALHEQESIVTEVLTTIEKPQEKPTVDIVEELKSNLQISTSVQSAPPAEQSLSSFTPDQIAKINSEMIDDLLLIRRDVIAFGRRFFGEHGDADTAEIKEVKEVVAMVESVGKSIVPEKSNTPIVNVNILMQNLVEKYKDDC